MNYRSTRSCLCTMLIFAVGVSIGKPALCDAGRTSLEKRMGSTRGLVLDKGSGAKGLNGTYSDSHHTLRFETVRFPRPNLEGQPAPERNYYIALRVFDMAGGTLILFSEGTYIPREWRPEHPRREKAAAPELVRLVEAAAQAVKELKLPKDLMPEQMVLVQQLAQFASSPRPTGATQ